AAPASRDDRVVENGEVRVGGRRRHVVDDLRARRRGVRVLDVERDFRRQAGVVSAAGGAGRAAGADLCAARGKRWKPEPPVEEGDVGGIPGVEADDGDRLAPAVVAGGVVVEAGELRGTEGIVERLARAEM